MFQKVISSKQNIVIIALVLIFIINISIQYFKYLNFKKDEVLQVKAIVENIYKKESINIVKLKTNNFNFFTSINLNEEINKLDLINILIITKNINFINYLKGFYANSIYFDILEQKQSFKNIIIQGIKKNHSDERIIEIFNALFLAIPISQDLRSVLINYSINHLIALSGYHLAVLSFIIYWILYYPYKILQERFFPYRNRRFDILIVTVIILFYYLLLTNIVPSLLRAFVMFCIFVYLLRSNIKIFSFMTLLYTVLIVLSLFPKYIFLIGFWFSIFAVFYIYLFIKYFSKYNKIIMFLFFNAWIFFIFNPIVHYYFPQTSYDQFYSIPITIFFNIFYPTEILLHILNLGYILDDYLKMFIYKNTNIFEVYTSFYFYILYIGISFLSIFSKKCFIILNILMVCFNFYLFKINLFLKYYLV